MASDTETQRLLMLALDVRRGIIPFVDVVAADRPKVAALLPRLSDAKIQELLGTRTTHGGAGVAHLSRVR
jgi:hypothetical protein